MGRSSALAVLTAVMAGVSLAGAAAQSIGEPIPGRKEAARKPEPATASRGARPCPEYGPGFVKVEGSSLCVRVGGSVRVDYGKRSRSDYGSSARGGAYLDARGDVGSLPFRAVVSGQYETGRDGWRNPVR